MKQKQQTKPIISAFAVAAVTFLAGLAVVSSLAATTSKEIEAEDATGAISIFDETASASHAMAFQAASETPVPPPPATGGNTVNVTDAASLQAALDGATPGSSIVMADGTYSGTFSIEKAATADKPISLVGSRNAIIDGGDAKQSGYALHLKGADYWHLEGFTVTKRQKGVMVDNTQNATIEKLAVTAIGHEGIHLRSNSSNNTVTGNDVSNTGQDNIEYGEGIYVGSAKSNWGSTSAGNTIPTPDKSDNNKLLGNNIHDTGGESMDIKEGTTGGTISGNTFDGTGMGGPYADSWIDMKGNNWTIDSNTGSNSKADGYQVHANTASGSWGENNVFSNNTITAGVPGYGFNLGKTGDTNTVKCDNKAPGAAKGLSDVACKQ